MRTAVVVLCMLTVVASLVIGVVPARAEWMFDWYVGGAFTSHATLTLFEPDEAAVSRMRDTRFDASVSFGGRGGYWLDFFPFLGFAVDASHFQADIPKQTVKDDGTFLFEFGRKDLRPLDLEATGAALLVMGRVPLMTGENFPHGRLQPYGGAGPALFFSRLKDSTNLEPARQSDSDTSVGVKAVAGVLWMVIKSVGVFGEYEFTHFGSTYHLHDSVSGRERFSTTVDTHHVVGGIAVRFP